MTNEDAVKRKAVLNTLDTMDAVLDENRTVEAYKELLKECYKELTSAQPCVDAVSREAVMKLKSHKPEYGDMIYAFDVELLPPVTPKQRLCKDCKFFEYDHVENVDGIPLIVAHEICNKWGDGCRTSEDGYCFLFKPKMEGESE